MSDSHSFGDSVVEEFVYDGRKCLVTQHPEIGHFCGYARTPFQFHYEDTRFNTTSLIEINGGLTYGVDDGGFIGFDCAHSWEECYRAGELVTDPSLSSQDTKEWTVSGVKKEVKHLADQPTALEKFVETVQ